LLFAMAANGEKGLAELSEVFSEEISLALALLGMCSIDEVSSSTII
jgi:isopentenyl diphosphate isomerase/L-lactate dehydrogenase-like FMN-dependent dehydrogenase